MMDRTKGIVLLVLVSAVLFSARPAACLQTLQPGMEAPDFSLADSAGAKKTFADIRGEKLTAVVFWSTWSARSLKLLERMQQIHEKYHRQGVSIVGVNADEQNISAATRAEIQNVANNLKITFPVLIDDGLTAFHDFGVIALPTTVLLDKNRKIVYELPGYPLVGAETMIDFIVSSVEGKKEVLPHKNAYQPDKMALRYYNLARAALRSKRTADSAEAWFKKSIELDAGFVQPYLSLGLFYRDRGDSAAAQQSFKDALAKQPDNPVALCELGMLLVSEGKVEEGVGMFEAARKSDEAYAPCYYYSGYALGKKGRLDDASKMFDAAQNLNRFDYRNFLYQGKLFEDRKDLPKAAEAYRKALEVILDIK